MILFWAIFLILIFIAVIAELIKVIYTVKINEQLKTANYRLLSIQLKDENEEKSKKEKNNVRPRDKARSINRYYRLKKQGICTNCGKNKSTEGTTRCNECKKRAVMRR